MDSVAECLELLLAGEAFSATRLAHGFWEGCVRLQRQIGASLDAASVDDPAAADLAAETPCFLETGFLPELTGLLRALAQSDDRLWFSASPHAWPGSDRIEGTPVAGLRPVLRLIEELVPEGRNRGDALLWKRAAIDGEIVRFYRELRHREVVVLGPPRLRSFARFAGLENCRHIEIPLDGARYQRLELERRIVDEHRVKAGPPPVYLLQAGSLATWLTLRLHGTLEHAVLLDLGNALNLCSLDTLLEENWSRVYRREVARTVSAIHPGWHERSEAFAKRSTPAARRDLWLELSLGVDRKIASRLIAPERRTDTASLAPSTEPGRVEFVERKEPDWGRVRLLLSRSREANHWTNFGPLSRVLEEAIASLVELSEDRAVVACSSASAAFSALVGAHCFCSGRRLRWVVSAFGFFNTSIGLLSDATVIDCDRHGVLDLEALGALDPSTYDGVVVTNPFALAPDWERFGSFCQERGKILLYDNAQALLGPQRTPAAPDEIVSFHHTKPWGAGEGGCAIVSRELEPVVRALINYGAGLGRHSQPYALNGKASDLACAFILERLERLPSWSGLYRLQERRIIALGAELGLTPLAPPNKLPRSAAPLLAEEAVPATALVGTRIPVAKYYRPLSEDAPTARRLYERILNVACHPGMARLSSDEIQAGLARLVDRVSSQPMDRATHGEGHDSRAFDPTAPEELATVRAHRDDLVAELKQVRVSLVGAVDQRAALRRERDAARDRLQALQAALEAAIEERDAVEQRAASLDGDLATTIGERDDAVRRAAELDGALAATIDERDAAVRRAAELDRDLATTIGERDAAVRRAAELDRDLATTIGERDEAERRAAAHQALIDEIVSSRSWRLTKPLRGLRALFGRSDAHGPASRRPGPVGAAGGPEE